MAKVVITRILKKQILRLFKQESVEIFERMLSLKKNPYKGKLLGNVSEVVIKELKHKKFRFYFITDGRVLKFGTEDELANLLIRFVRMSEKKDQKKVIREIKNVLRTMGFNKT